MTPTEYNEALVRLGAAAGLITSVNLDAIAVQADKLELLLAATTADDDGKPIDNVRRAELRATLMGVKQLVSAARSFRALMPRIELKGGTDGAQTGRG